MEPRNLSKRQFDRLKLSAHRRYLERRVRETAKVWRLWVDGRAAVIRGWAGAMTVTMDARVLQDPHALSKRGF
jgi:hypothetical protein